MDKYRLIDEKIGAGYKLLQGLLGNIVEVSFKVLNKIHDKFGPLIL